MGVEGGPQCRRTKTNAEEVPIINEAVSSRTGFSSLLATSLLSWPFKGYIMAVSSQSQRPKPKATPKITKPMTEINLNPHVIALNSVPNPKRYKQFDLGAPATQTPAH